MLTKNYEYVKGSCGVKHKDIVEWRYCKSCEKIDRARANRNNFSRESVVKQDRVQLKSYRVIDNQPRTNILTIKQLKDGQIIFFLENGKNKETGYHNMCSIMLDKNNVKMLKDYLKDK